MGAVKQEQRGLFFKRSIIVVLFVLGLVTLFFVWQYFINRPNYRDLEREYRKITIPTDWQLINRSDDKGALGYICWEIDNSACPSISTQYETVETKSPDIDLDILYSIARDLGYDVQTDNNDSCKDDAIQYSCKLTASKNNYALVLSIGATSENHQKSLTILLGQKNGIGLK